MKQHIEAIFMLELKRAGTWSQILKLLVGRGLSGLSQVIQPRVMPDSPLLLWIMLCYLLLWFWSPSLPCPIYCGRCSEESETSKASSS